MSLYQEMRPDNLDDIVGNSTTIGGLVSMMRKPADSRPHAILLKGPNGCGKTTIARILAKEFGSDEGSTIRISANNTNGIETVREINNNAHLVGLGGGAKTYIIDESHELTNRAQEGFLDIIEDNPSHCYFIFCTTNPEALIKGIRNRCTDYEVSLLRRSEIVEVLERVCQKKSLEVSSDILEAITLTCDGSPRAALVSLEQVAGIKDVGEALELLVSGTERDASVIDLLKLLTMAPGQRRKKWKQIILTFDAISADSEVIRKSILTFLYNRLKRYDSVEDAMDIAHLLKIFSVNTFYGKKSQLGALIARACFETWSDN
jgi:DNA polymerase III gamma/tau subunit